MTKESCRTAFDIDEGPFCQALDKALGTFKVYREAYYGGTFTGNHAHKCLKVGNNDVRIHACMYVHVLVT